VKLLLSLLLTGCLLDPTPTAPREAPNDADTAEPVTRPAGRL
jgi:hypothetical protein